MGLFCEEQLILWAMLACCNLLPIVNFSLFLFWLNFIWAYCSGLTRWDLHWCLHGDVHGKRYAPRGWRWSSLRCSILHWGCWILHWDLEVQPFRKIQHSLCGEWKNLVPTSSLSHYRGGERSFSYTYSSMQHTSLFVGCHELRSACEQSSNFFCSTKLCHSAMLGAALMIMIKPTWCSSSVYINGLFHQYFVLIFVLLWFFQLDIISSLFSGRIVWEKVSPALQRAVQSQVQSSSYLSQAVMLWNGCGSLQYLLLRCTVAFLCTSTCR